MTIGNATPLHFGMVDHSNERTGTQLYVPALATNGSNMNAVLGNPTTSNAQLIKDALILMTLCNMVRTIASIIVDESVPSLPSSAAAQRELAVRFTYVDDDTGKAYSFTVPGPESTIVPSGTDEVDLGNVVVAAFVVTIEANAVSPDGNTITITGARVIGRNS